MTARRLGQSFFHRPVETVAREVIGSLLLFAGVGGVIVETEAYGDEDPASHSVRGMTDRNRSMFGLPGCAYVYRSYGIHWCLNLVCGIRPGSAVLVRAIEPLFGLDVMRSRRGALPDTRLCSGPGRLCAALGIDRRWDGHDLNLPPFDLRAGPDRLEIDAGPRIGISQAVDVPWRFGAVGSPYLSKPMRDGKRG
ncbi:DNA-3-methyladenine glycosylase [Bosea sp. CCNWLW174]|uniref:DNA-3-methyladenine glycosylase n=1 Tax=unclassified Bosea (in: a-proteobacteria) TaxID=2653178 RepID=UPI0030143763